MNSTDRQALESILTNRPSIPLSQAIFLNETPPGWAATIVAVSAHFIYKNAAGQKIDEELISRVANVQANGQTTIVGTKALCAMSIDQAMTVVVDESATNLGPQLSGADPNKCLLRVSMAAVQARVVSMNDVPQVQQMAFRKP